MRETGLDGGYCRTQQKVLGGVPSCRCEKGVSVKQWLTLKDPETKNASGSICLIGCWRHNPQP